MSTHIICEEFISYVTDKTKLYNPRGRSARKMRMDIECEYHEWFMIKEGLWLDDPDWRIDAWMPTSDGNISVDVKFISKYYNLSPTKVCNIITQRNVVDYYYFMRWIKRPQRPLVAGDEISYESVGMIPHAEIMDAMRPSTNYKDWGTSHYVDVTRLLREIV